tara:strand:+ start:506 stop:625 length:120 start_codon:yes stop_codon:yes gene_type:complete
MSVICTKSDSLNDKSSSSSPGKLKVARALKKEIPRYVLN